VDEAHEVGVRGDLAGAAEVGQARAAVLAVLDRLRRVREDDDGDVEGLGDVLLEERAFASSSSVCEP
jgi:hypothetical protein